MELPNGKKEKPEKVEKKEFEEYFRRMPLERETSCGYGYMAGKNLQLFANKKGYIFFYGLAGCLITAGYAYFNGIVSTIEKRFKIPSRNTGVISVGNDVSQLLVSVFITYYVGNRHKPRWMAIGLVLTAIYCLCTALPHFLYGGGSDALALTKEYGSEDQHNVTTELIEKESRKVLCQLDGESAHCEVNEGNFAPQVVLFMAQFTAGIGNTLYSSLGAAYMDDNVKKTKAPVLISITYFIKLLGPSIGYALSSLCLKYYITPWLTPTITPKDPRWLGAWWIGWIVMGVGLLIVAFIVSLFPKELPRSAARKKFYSRQNTLECTDPEKIELEAKFLQTPDETESEKEAIPTSLSDMWTTLKRLFKNKILMCNNIAGVLYLFGFLPYWVFMPKYIENQYRVSASSANLFSGAVGFVFTAIGVLSSGAVVSKFKPTARQMAAWNVMTGLATGFVLLGYIYIGCDANDNAIFVNSLQNSSVGIQECNLNCHCDFVKYSPVCGEDGNSYISACHAGCTERTVIDNTTDAVMYENCSCVLKAANSTGGFGEFGGSARSGSCSIDCTKFFYYFLTLSCVLNLVSSSGIATNFLVAVRCVSEKDKPVSIGMGMAMTAFFAFIPSPIFFGHLIDTTCTVWGKTCTGTGNCWLYDNYSFRYLLNGVSSCFMFLAVIFDFGVWYYVKDLQIFDVITDNNDATQDSKQDKVEKNIT